MLRRLILLVCVFAFVGVGVASAVTYTFYDLSVAGDNSSYAYAINSSNEVTGRYFPASGSYAFVWSPTAFPRTQIPALNGGTTGVGFAINSYGIVGGLSSASSPTGNRAFYWTPTVAHGNTGTLTDVGLKVAGSTSSRILSINSLGQCVGYGSISGSSTGFYWDGVSASATIINAPAGAGGNSGFLNAGINDSGLTAGYYQNPKGGGDAAVIWHPGDANSTEKNTVIKAALIPTDTCSSRFMALNNSGEIVGYYQPGMNFIGKPILYVDDTHIYDLGLSAPAGFNGNGNALSINAAGTAVGTAYLNDGTTQHAFIWTPTVSNGTSGTMADLNTVVAPPSGWYYQYAWGINDFGSICGIMTNGTSYKGFALIAPVPEPSTLLLAATGLVGLIAYAWRKRK
jgi:hypothetical protein